MADLAPPLALSLGIALVAALAAMALIRGARSHAAHRKREAEFHTKLWAVLDELLRLVQRTNEQLRKVGDSTRELAERVASCQVALDDVVRRIGDLSSLPSELRQIRESQVQLETLTSRLSVHQPAGRATVAGVSEPSEPPTASDEYAQLIAIGRAILTQVAPKGRAAPLAELPTLSKWLGASYPEVLVEAIHRSAQDQWLLVVLTRDRSTGIGVPALDLRIGPDPVLKWFEGGRYDGTQALELAHVRAFAKAQRVGDTWEPVEKGRIDLDARGGS